MIPDKKKYFLLAVMVIGVLLIPAFLFAQDPGDPGGDPDAPIDNGVILLLLVGIFYGLKWYKSKKQVNRS